MSVKFLGQFLIERGYVDEGNIREALELMDERNRGLGDVAIGEGFMSEREATRVNNAQRTHDRPFGELAVEMGMLTEGQLETVLDRQRKARLMIGEALIDLGHLEVVDLARALDEFKVDQAPYEIGAVKLPEELADSVLAQHVVDLVPKFCMRISRLHAKLGPVGAIGDLSLHPFRVSVMVRGAEDLSIALLGDEPFATRIAAGAAGLPADRLDEGMISDGMGEFLNVLAGNAMGILERKGGTCQLDPPCHRANPTAGFYFDIVTTEGRGALVLDRSARRPHGAGAAR